MNKKSVIFSLALVLVVIAMIIMAFKSQKCEPNYAFADANILTLFVAVNGTEQPTEDYQTYKKFQSCPEGLKEISIIDEEPGFVDSIYEIVYYCESENNFLVVRGGGAANARYYIYNGKPCK